MTLDCIRPSQSSVIHHSPQYWSEMFFSFTKMFVCYYRYTFIFTSVKEVMFLPDFVCLSVCLCVSKITQKVMDGSF